MIQINLIPDVKRELIRAQQMRRAAITISIIVGAAAVGAVVLLSGVLAAQQIRITIAKNDIAKNYKSLQSVDNVDDILTLQNQLSKVTTYNDTKTMDSRLFDVINAINPIAPNNVTYSVIKNDPTTKTLSIEGSAASGYSATETLRKTILNTKVETTADGQTTSVPLTDTVAVVSTSYGQSSDGAQVLRFTMSFVYPDGLFDNKMKSIRIVTPTSQADVTDSNTRVPDSLFSQKATDIKEGN